MRSLWCAILILLIAGQGVNLAPASTDARRGSGADDKDPNDPNESLQTKSGIVVKDPNELKELLQAKWDAIISVLLNKDSDQKTKEKQIDKMVHPMYDFPLMAKLALGREHWPKLTPPQHEKFTQLFVERLKSSYLEKVSLYTDEKASFQPVAQKKKNVVYVPMQLTSKEKEITILYKLRKVDPPHVGWKIYDVEIQGVSILLTYRSQFDDILRRGTVKDLLSQLEKPPNP